MARYHFYISKMKIPGSEQKYGNWERPPKAHENVACGNTKMRSCPPAPYLIWSWKEATHPRASRWGTPGVAKQVQLRQAVCCQHSKKFGIASRSQDVPHRVFPWPSPSRPPLQRDVWAHTGSHLGWLSASTRPGRLKPTQLWSCLWINFVSASLGLSLMSRTKSRDGAAQRGGMAALMFQWPVTLGQQHVAQCRLVALTLLCCAWLAKWSVVHLGTAWEEKDSKWKRNWAIQTQLRLVEDLSHDRRIINATVKPLFVPEPQTRGENPQ